MDVTKSFDLSICRLLQEYPLYDYRTPIRGGSRLSILLIGHGPRLDILRDKVLAHGQLLDTELDVTVITKNKAAALSALRENAPDLERFIEIPEAGNPRPAEWKCGTLHIEEQPSLRRSLRPLLLRHPECRYVLVSLESTQPPPRDLAPAPGQLIAWVRKRETGKGGKKEYEIHVCGSRPMVLPPERDDRSMREILDIAYRLHYAYEKGNDPHITNQEIRTRFDDLYNYQSNIECALHVRSKIKCAGIDPSALNSAAEEFAKKLAEDARNNGDLLERLAQLEHRRWCVSKAAGGRCCDSETVNVIYGDDGSTTHNTGSSKKWHVALVPYGKDGALCRHLLDQDWTNEDPESIEDLDELDKQTLRVHRRCGEISGEKLHRCLEHIAKLKARLPKELRLYADHMQSAVTKMCQGDRDAVFAYRYHLRNLKKALSAAKSKAGKNVLQALEQDMGAPIEYLTRKDYKKQNLILVGSIPFALCGWKSTVLVKLMAESIQDCVAAAWQLEPGHIVFVDTAQTLEELKQLHRRSRQIERFLTRNCNLVRSSYHVFVPGKTKCFPDIAAQKDAEENDVTLYLENIKDYDPSFFGSGDWFIHACPTLYPDDLRPRFVDLMCEYGATSIDMTGGKPALITLADGYARNNRAGAFFIRDNQIRDFYGARGMEQQSLEKGLTVQQLFDQTEAEMIKRDDEKIDAAFFEKYQALWKIAHENAPVWYNFCLCFAKAYRDKPGSPHAEEYLRVPAGLLRTYFAGKFRMAGENRVLTGEFEAILDALVDAGLLTYNGSGAFYQAACEEVVACLRNSGKVLEYYIYCTVKFSPTFQNQAMSWLFRHNAGASAAKNEVDIICTAGHTPVFISAKNVTADSLGKNNFLNYVCYEVGWLADRFGSLGTKTILAAPNVPQFENGQRSDYVARAMSRGVYLLGDRCFEPGKLSKVLDLIVRDKKDWCEFLLGEKEPELV